MTVSSVGGVALVAASGLAREAAEAIRGSYAQHVCCVLDDDPDRWGTLVAGIPVIGPIAATSIPAGGRPVLCAGRGASREVLVARLDLAPECYGSVTHPSFELPGSGSIGVGCIVLAGVVATADVHIGDHVVIMPGAVLTHDDLIGDFATVCGGAVLAGNVVVGRGAYVGQGAMVRQGVRIGAYATVGMGAVVLSDVPDGEVWAGNPARPLAAHVLAAHVPTSSAAPVPPAADVSPASSTHVPPASSGADG